MSGRGKLLTLNPALAGIPEGALVAPAEIAARVFDGNVTARWVLDHVPRRYRHTVGRKVLYFESEVRAWIRTLREVA